MTGAAVVPATSATITPELSAKRARLNAIPAERNAARRAGDVAAVLRLEVEAEDLAGEIGELEQQLRAAAAQEQASREVASAERQRIVRAELEAAVATESAAVGHALDQLATKSGQLRRAVEALAAMEPDPWCSSPAKPWRLGCRTTRGRSGTWPFWIGSTVQRAKRCARYEITSSRSRRHQ